MLKWLKSFFKKEEKIKVIEPKKNKMDLSKYKMQMNIKSICYFEKISGKSFFKFDMEDALYLMYATFLVNNPETNITFNVFTGIMENEHISKWMVTKYQDILTVVYQFEKAQEEVKEEKFSMDVSSTMTDFATSLIIDYGMDARYVMYEMDMWEIGEYFEAVNMHIRREMENERFWTYIKILPHIDSKKCKSPEALVPFDWEKQDKKKRSEAELKDKEFAIKNMLGKKMFE